MSSPFGNLPDVAGQVREAWDSLFEHIDPEQTPLAYSVKAEGPGVLKAIGGLVNAIAALETRLGAQEGN